MQEYKAFDAEEAETVIQRYTALNPERGERMIKGDLLARTGMTISRHELREIIHRVDEAGVADRGDFLKKRIVRYNKCSTSRRS